MTSYKNYAADDRHHLVYAEYQQRYADTVRDSDRVLIELVRGVAAESSALRVLDVGCSTGNLLRHLRRELPEASLKGVDLAEVEIAACRADTALSGIEFDQADLLELPATGEFDVVIANAILYALSRSEFEVALERIAGALRPGGSLLAFDFFHRFEQDVTIIERSKAFPDGHPLHFRPFVDVDRSLRQAGFDDPDFMPFAISVDLEGPGDPADVSSYTIRTEDRRRLLFRGTLYQPWCHLSARKRA